MARVWCSRRGFFLAITGGEALYTDRGHIGRNPICTTWYGIMLPTLLLNYAGQTAEPRGEIRAEAEAYASADSHAHKLIGDGQHRDNVADCSR